MSGALQLLLKYLQQEKDKGVEYVKIDEELLNEQKNTQMKSKEELYASLLQQMMQCAKCKHLADTRLHVVPGEGSLDAKIIICAEAPGKNEDLQGKPFCGKSGILLDKILAAMKLKREDVFICNILKCRPNTDKPTGDRKPASDEVSNCINYLYQQIEIIKPAVIITLGDTALKSLMPEIEEGITKIRGKWLKFKGVDLMPTYHPAYVLRNQSLKIKREVWEDMLQVMEKVGMDITEEQKSYFKE